MTSPATAAPEFKSAFIAAARALWASDEPDVKVSFGHPGMRQPDDIVAFTKLTSKQEPGPHGARRARDEVLTIDVQISCYRGGRGDDVEQICSDRAYKLLRDLEKYVRVTDTTVGGTVLDCFLTAHDSDGETDRAFLAKGRCIEITATFTANVRITS